MTDQLDLGVDAAPDPRILRAWRALPFRSSRTCAGCGEVTLTAGKRRSSQRCLACFAITQRKGRS